ncbi:MAG: hypothetical protein K2Q09_03215 [Phycisphaerales bacterium]|nr:hypothetical protein [Phycisphaerales bacterium]
MMQPSVEREPNQPLADWFDSAENPLRKKLLHPSMYYLMRKSAQVRQPHLAKAERIPTHISSGFSKIAQFIRKVGGALNTPICSAYLQEDAAVRMSHLLVGRRFDVDLFFASLLGSDGTVPSGLRTNGLQGLSALFALLRDEGHPSSKVLCERALLNLSRLRHQASIEQKQQKDETNRKLKAQVGTFQQLFPLVEELAEFVGRVWEETAKHIACTSARLAPAVPLRRGRSSTSEVQPAIDCLSLIFGGGACFPLRSSFIPSSRMTNEPRARGSNIYVPPCGSAITVTIGPRNGQKGHSIDHLFIPETTHSMLRQLVETYPGLLCADFTTASSTPFHALPAIPVPSCIYNHPTDRFSARHLRRSYATLLQFLFFINRLTALEFAAAVFSMCHGVAVAMSVYCCLASLQPLLCTAQAKKRAEDEYAAFIQNAYGSVAPRNEKAASKLHKAASRAWHVLQSFVVAVRQHTCEHCQLTFDGQLLQHACYKRQYDRYK